jgi:hypothetical protein
LCFHMVNWSISSVIFLVLETRKRSLLASFISEE